MRNNRKTATRIAEDAARQEALYAFLLERGDKWTSMERCTDTIRLYPAFFTTSYHNSTARRMLTEDIEAINASDHFDHIIVSGNRGVKLATEHDYRRFVESEMREIFTKLKRLRRIIRKGRGPAQYDLEGRISQAFLEEES